MTTILADYSLGDALLTTLWIFFFVVWLWVLIIIIMDLFRDHELSGWWKAVWLLFLIFIPVLTGLLYLIVRGHGMRDRAIAEQKQIKQAQDEYIRDVASSSPADELHKLNDLRDKGALTQEEFDAAKAKVLA